MKMKIDKKVQLVSFLGCTSEGRVDMKEDIINERIQVKKASRHVEDIKVD